MLTPQEISERSFVKAVFGGYDMSAVDDFLESLTTDYSALYKENAILKSKIKVLVEKVEEYRSTEDAMRMALLTAQKMGEDLLSEAQKKSEEIQASVEKESKQRLSELSSGVADEESRLNAAKEATRKYVEESKSIIARHQSFLDSLDSISAPASAPAPKAAPSREEEIVDTARTIDDAVSKLIAKDEAVSTAPSVPDKAEELDEGEPTKMFRVKTEDSDWSDEDEPTSPRPKFNFDNLQFGSNYAEDAN